MISLFEKSAAEKLEDHSQHWLINMGFSMHSGGGKRGEREGKEGRVAESVEPVVLLNHNAPG